MQEQKILIVEDDADIREMLSEFLMMEGYQLDFAFDGQDALEKYDDTHNLILLDLMLPKKNGATVLSEIRKKSYVPIIIISAKDSDFDKSLILDLGADDYVAKPFSLMELHARIKSCLRRANFYAQKQEDPIVLTFLDLTVNVESFSVMKNEVAITLTNTEFEILKLFMQNPKKVFTKEDIYQSVWKEAYYGDEHLVNVHMSRLREKIEENPKAPQYIQTLWGIGYRLKEQA